MPTIKIYPVIFKNGIHGFFFTGQKSPPITIPNLDLELGVMKLKFGGECGVDARVYMNFSNGGAVLGIGAMAFAHAWFTLTSITCTTIDADGRAELLLEGEYNTATKVVSGHGCASVHIMGNIQQCFPALVGCVGCLDLKIDNSVKIDLGINSSGFNNFSFSTGNCSNPTICK